MKILCKKCGRECASYGGLQTHMRVKHTKEYKVEREALNNAENKRLSKYGTQQPWTFQKFEHLASLDFTASTNDLYDVEYLVELINEIGQPLSSIIAARESPKYKNALEFYQSASDYNKHALCKIYSTSKNEITKNGVMQRKSITEADLASENELVVEDSVAPSEVASQTLELIDNAEGMQSSEQINSRHEKNETVHLQDTNTPQKFHEIHSPLVHSNRDSNDENSFVHKSQIHSKQNHISQMDNGIEEESSPTNNSNKSEKELSHEIKSIKLSSEINLQENCRSNEKWNEDDNNCEMSGEWKTHGQSKKHCEMQNMQKEKGNLDEFEDNDSDVGPLVMEWSSESITESPRSKPSSIQKENPICFNEENNCNKTQFTLPKGDLHNLNKKLESVHSFSNNCHNFPSTQETSNSLDLSPDNVENKSCNFFLISKLIGNNSKIENDINSKESDKEKGIKEAGAEVDDICGVEGPGVSSTVNESVCDVQEIIPQEEKAVDENKNINDIEIGEEVDGIRGMEGSGVSNTVNESVCDVQKMNQPEEKTLNENRNVNEIGVGEGVNDISGMEGSGVSNTVNERVCDVQKMNEPEEKNVEENRNAIIFNYLKSIKSFENCDKNDESLMIATKIAPKPIENDIKLQKSSMREKLSPSGELNKSIEEENETQVNFDSVCKVHQNKNPSKQEHSHYVNINKKKLDNISSLLENGSQTPQPEIYKKTTLNCSASNYSNDNYTPKVLDVTLQITENQTNCFNLKSISSHAVSRNQQNFVTSSESSEEREVSSMQSHESTCHGKQSCRILSPNSACLTFKKFCDSRLKSPARASAVDSDTNFSILNNAKNSAKLNISETNVGANKYLFACPESRNTAPQNIDCYFDIGCYSGCRSNETVSSMKSTNKTIKEIQHEITDNSIPVLNRQVIKSVNTIKNAYPLITRNKKEKNITNVVADLKDSLLSPLIYQRRRDIHPTKIGGNDRQLMTTLENLGGEESDCRRRSSISITLSKLNQSILREKKKNKVNLFDLKSKNYNELGLSPINKSQSSVLKKQYMLWANQVGKRHKNSFQELNFTAMEHKRERKRRRVAILMKTHRTKVTIKGKRSIYCIPRKMFISRSRPRHKNAAQKFNITSTKYEKKSLWKRRRVKMLITTYRTKVTLKGKRNMYCIPRKMFISQSAPRCVSKGIERCELNIPWKSKKTKRCYNYLEWKVKDMTKKCAFKLPTANTYLLGGHSLLREKPVGKHFCKIGLSGMEPLKQNVQLEPDKGTKKKMLKNKNNDGNSIKRNLISKRTMKKKESQINLKFLKIQLQTYLKKRKKINHRTKASYKPQEVSNG